MYSNKIKMKQRNGHIMKKMIFAIAIIVNMMTIVTGQEEEEEGQDQISEEAEEMKENLMSSRDFDPSRVRALPLAAGRNVGGNYKWHFTI